MFNLFPCSQSCHNIKAFLFSHNSMYVMNAGSQVQLLWLSYKKGHLCGIWSPQHTKRKLHHEIIHSIKRLILVEYHHVRLTLYWVPYIHLISPRAPSESRLPETFWFMSNLTPSAAFEAQIKCKFNLTCGGCKRTRKMLTVCDIIWNATISVESESD